MTLQNAIALATARLRNAFPEVSGCAVFVDGIKNGTPRFSARLDLRLPECQILVCGAPAASVDGALEAALGAARERLFRRAGHAAAV